MKAHHVVKNWCAFFMTYRFLLPDKPGAEVMLKSNISTLKRIILRANDPELIQKIFSGEDCTGMS